MKSLRWFACLVLAALSCLRADDTNPRPATWIVDPPGKPGRPVEFREAADEVEVSGQVETVPGVRVHGVFRTRQALDPRSALSYHLSTNKGELVLFDGPRSQWRQSDDGWLEAEFAVENDSVHWEPGAQSALRVQFDYVVEGEYWQSDKFPETFLPSIELPLPPPPGAFEIRWTWIPPVLPARVPCWFPAQVRAAYGVEPPPPYLPSPDLLAAAGDRRVEAPRSRIPWEGDGEGVVWYRLANLAPQKLLARPGFVWDGVEWVSNYPSNPYRVVRVVGPMAYLAGTIGVLLLLRAAGRLLGRVRRAWLRRGGRVLVVGAAVYFFAAAAVSYFGLIAVGLAALFWMQDRVRETGPRLYWTMWGLLLLLDFFCLHIHVEAPGQWAGTTASAAFAGLALLPLRLVRRPRLAAILGSVLALVIVVLGTAMMVYRDFFGDYPGVSDLLMAGQAGELGDSIGQLVGQEQLVPAVLGVVACVRLWRR